MTWTCWRALDNEDCPCCDERDEYVEATVTVSLDVPGAIATVGLCTTHSSPGLWFADGSGGCMVEQTAGRDLGEHEWVQLYRVGEPDDGFWEVEL